MWQCAVIYSYQIQWPGLSSSHLTQLTGPPSRSPLFSLLPEHPTLFALLLLFLSLHGHNCCLFSKCCGIRGSFPAPLFLSMHAASLGISSAHAILSAISELLTPEFLYPFRAHTHVGMVFSTLILTGISKSDSSEAKHKIS